MAAAPPTASSRFLGLAGIPVVIYFVMGARAATLLAGLKDWMSAHNAVIMSVLCPVITAKLVGRRDGRPCQLRRDRQTPDAGPGTVLAMGAS
jgi:hypothetical protein